MDKIHKEVFDPCPQCGPGPTYDRSAWMDVKFTLGLDFPNLPYYMEKNVISVLFNIWPTFEDKFPGCNAQNTRR